MIKSKCLLVAAAVLAVAASSAIAQTTVYVTPTNSQGWTNGDTSAGSVSAISPLYPRSGDSSAQLLTTSTGKASYELYWNPIMTNPFGTSQTTIGNLTNLSMDFYRSSLATAPDFGAPALRFFFNDGAGHSGSLVYEFVYNGSGPGNPTVPTDTWLNADFLNSKVWMRTNNTNYDVVNGGLLTLQQWLDPNVAKLNGTFTLTADTYITGVQFSYGSGAGIFNGAVDNVHVGFTGGNHNLYNFEAVPEPSSISLGLLGIAGLAASWRFRRLRKA